MGRWLCLVGVLVAGFVCGGCKTGSSDPEFADLPGKTAAAGGTADNAQTNSTSPEIIQVGDSLTITFSDLPVKIEPLEERVKEDGTITLIENQSFTALGKTRGQLEREIREAYVPKYYTRMTVNIKPQERAFFIGGEVKSSGRQYYVGPITLTKAIQQAGDFTDFANKKKIRLVRGKNTHVFNWYKLLDHPELDPPILPGDRIQVPRRIF